MIHSSIKNRQRHPYHLVDPSPWPLLASFGALALTFGLVMYMHGYYGGFTLFTTGFLTILFVMYVWWRDIIREGTFEGQHTIVVQTGLRMGRRSLAARNTRNNLATGNKIKSGIFTMARKT